MRRLVLVLAVIIFFTSINAQWEQTEGPYGGQILVLFGANEYLFAATNGNGIYRSSDNGLNWNTANEGLTSLFIKAFIAKDDLIFAGTSKGVFISKDFGLTWHASNNGIENFSIKTFVVNNDDILASTSSGVFRSNDLGASWHSSQQGLNDARVTSFVVSENFILAGTRDKGIYKSTDNGFNWFSSNEGLSEFRVNSIAKFNNLILAGISSAVYYSSDDGSTWNTTGLSETIYSFSFYKNSIYAITYDQIYKSDDNGSSWNRINSNLVDGYRNTLLSYNGNLFIGTEHLGGNIYRSTNGGADWSVCSNGLINSSVHKLKIIDKNIYAFQSSNGLFRSSDSGKSWIQIIDGLPGIWLGTGPWIRSLVANENNLFAETRHGIYLSTDNGISWSITDSGMNNHYATSIAKLDKKIIVAASEDYNRISKIYVSENNGISWDEVNSGPGGVGISTQFAVCNNYVFAGTEKNGILRSSDSGSTWEKLENGLPYNCIIAVNAFGENIFAVAKEFEYSLSSMLFRSTNHGTSWTEVNNNNASFYVKSLASFKEYIFATSLDGIYISKDGGELWNLFIERNSLNFNPNTLLFDNNYIYAGTQNKGVWKRRIDEILTNISEQEHSSPSEYILEQNYPNPFNPTTTIKFSIPNVADAFHAYTTQVTLKIYDVLGNEITTLVNEQKQPGVYEVTFDGSNLSSGVYFYSLAVSSSASSGEAFNQTKKLLLMK